MELQVLFSLADFLKITQLRGLTASQNLAHLTPHFAFSITSSYISMLKMVPF